MRLFSLLVISLLSISTELFCQSNEPKIEYASIYLKVYYQGNFIKYDRTGQSKSPLLSLPDGKTYILEDMTDPKTPKEFTSLNNMLNYMVGFGWRLIQSNILPYEGDMGNTSKSNIINTNEYLQILMFEKTTKSEQQK